VIGSHPFSSKASYRYPRKKTSSGRATRIAWRRTKGPKGGTPAPWGVEKGGSGRAERRRNAMAPAAPSARKRTTFLFPSVRRVQDGARPPR